MPLAEFDTRTPGYTGEYNKVLRPGSRAARELAKQNGDHGYGAPSPAPSNFTTPGSKGVGKGAGKGQSTPVGGKGDNGWMAERGRPTTRAQEMERSRSAMPVRSVSNFQEGKGKGKGKGPLRAQSAPPAPRPSIKPWVPKLSITTIFSIHPACSLQLIPSTRDLFIVQTPNTNTSVKETYGPCCTVDDICEVMLRDLVFTMKPLMNKVGHVKLRLAFGTFLLSDPDGSSRGTEVSTSELLNGCNSQGWRHRFDDHCSKKLHDAMMQAGSLTDQKVVYQFQIYDHNSSRTLRATVNATDQSWELIKLKESFTKDFCCDIICPDENCHDMRLKCCSSADIVDCWETVESSLAHLQWDGQSSLAAMGPDQNGFEISSIREKHKRQVQLGSMKVSLARVIQYQPNREPRKKIEVSCSWVPFKTHFDFNKTGNAEWTAEKLITPQQVSKFLNAAFDMNILEYGPPPVKVAVWDAVPQDWSGGSGKGNKGGYRTSLDSTDHYGAGGKGKGKASGGKGSGKGDPSYGKGKGREVDRQGLPWESPATDLRWRYDESETVAPQGKSGKGDGQGQGTYRAAQGNATMAPNQYGKGFKGKSGGKGQAKGGDKGASCNLPFNDWSSGGKGKGKGEVGKSGKGY